MRIANAGNVRRSSSLFFLPVVNEDEVGVIGLKRHAVIRRARVLIGCGQARARRAPQSPAARPSGQRRANKRQAAREQNSSSGSVPAARTHCRAGALFELLSAVDHAPREDADQRRVDEISSHRDAHKLHPAEWSGEQFDEQSHATMMGDARYYGTACTHTPVSQPVVNIHGLAWVATAARPFPKALRSAGCSVKS